MQPNPHCYQHSGEQMSDSTWGVNRPFNMPAMCFVIELKYMLYFPSYENSGFCNTIMFIFLINKSDLTRPMYA